MSADNETKGALGGAFWIDLFGPAVAINPPGASSDPGRDTATGWLEFGTTGTDLIYQSYQLPHGYIEGQLLGFEPHLHWHKKTSASGTVAWSMRYRWTNPGSVWSGWSSPIAGIAMGLAHDDTAEKSAVTTFGYLSLPDAKISALILCEISRLGDSDSYAADAVLTDADAHVLVNQVGSVQTYTKYHHSLQYQ